MHFKDGSEAKVGQRCRFKAGQYADDGKNFIYVQREGLIVSITPGATACNAQVAYPWLQVISGQGTPGEVRLVKLETATVTLGECERSDLPAT